MAQAWDEFAGHSAVGDEKCPAPTADETTSEAKTDDAPTATERSIPKPVKGVRRGIKRTTDTTGSIPKNDSGKSKGGRSELDSTSRPNSTTSDSPISGSKGHWRQPETLSEFASQVNAVATRVLNGEIDLEKAKVYGGLTRVAAQTLSIEVQRSRFLRERPLLDMDAQTFDDED